MIINLPKVLKDVQGYVEALYNKLQSAELLYHNLEHTQKVVMQCNQISAAYVVDETDGFIITVAAWFHDTGHLFGVPLNHEERSVEIMKDYLEKKVEDTKIIDAIAGCIMATKVPHRPTTLAEKIICDADTFNLGTKDFTDTDSRLKKELQLRVNIPPDDWDSDTLNMLIKHKYFTSYCRKLLNRGKQENIAIVIERIQGNLLR
ncbi:MAG TPA: HD domain-containing protein [Ginsengibacter sp.]